MLKKCLLKILAVTYYAKAMLLINCYDVILLLFKFLYYLFFNTVGVFCRSIDQSIFKYQHIMHVHW